VSQRSPGSYRSIVVVDMAGFTSATRTQLHRTAMVDGLKKVLDAAFDDSGIDLSRCEVEDRGDGKIILIPPAFAKSQIADRLPGRLRAELDRHNAVHAPEATIQLRVAMHAGDVQFRPDSFIGDEINHTCRIIEAAEAKNVLTRSGGVLALIVSDHFHHNVIETDPGTAPTEYRRIPVLVKETHDVAWLRILGGQHDVPDESRVIGVLPESELIKLRDLLVGIYVPQLPTLVGRAAGPGVPPMRREADAWEAVRYLSDFNAGPDGLPPPMVFVELVAAQLDADRALPLRRWNDEQAKRCRLGPALRELRAADHPSVDATLWLHLVIVIEHDGVDRDLYQLSYWRQDDPDTWPPPRGETRIVAFDDLEAEVDQLVMNAEIAWTGLRGDAAVEFVLPRTLLSVPVDQWYKERASGSPRPLSLDYPILVRSLERMLARHWHRSWINRWRTLIDDPDSARVYFAGGAETDKPFRIDVALKEPQHVSMVLSAAPSPEAKSGDELGSALRGGLPVVLWCRGEGDGLADAFRRFVTRLADSGGLIELPRRTLSARQDALGGTLAADIDPRVVHNLVVLWDDPARMVNLDQPPPVAAQGGHR
jgi:class 3 adenylate cyclase